MTETIKTGMALRHDLAIGNSLDPIAVTFVMVEQAARLIAAADPAAAAAAIRQGIDASFYTDPTLAQRYLAAELGVPFVNDSDRDQHSNWGWPLSEVRRIEPPAPARGAQGWWNWNPGEHHG